ncbi:MAG TPA: ribonuclease III [Candidatus Binatia bacterium]
MSQVIQERLVYQFRKPELLETALTHRSRGATSGKAGDKAPSNNEKLEFLGDAVLDLAVSDLLMQHFPRYQEGDLSKLRASLVNARILGEKARALGLGQEIRLGKGEEKSGGREKESILAAAYEALIGAIYLDRGFVAARRVLAKQFAADLKARAGAASDDWKTRLQEITQRTFKTTPTYTLVRETGPDHAKHFVSQISVGDRTLGRGEGKTKKSAEQAAASAALQALQTEATLQPKRAAGGEAAPRAKKGSSGTGGER